MSALSIGPWTAGDRGFGVALGPWFSTVRHGGRRWLRFNLVNRNTREEHVRPFVKLLHRTVRGLSVD